MPGFGRRPSTDVRNVAHLMHRRLAPAEIASTVLQKTWGFRGVPLDQGNTGTCTGHAAAHFIHCSPIAHRRFLDPFVLYREAVLLDEYDDNDDDATKITNAGLQAGSSGTGVAKALSRRELISEYLWAQRFEDAITWVLTRGPVMVGSNWYSSMNPDASGHLKITGGAGIIGGHEWLIRGVNKKRGLALVVNSWGPTWGGVGRWESAKIRGGHALIDFDTLARLFHEDGDAVSALESGKPKPPA